MRVHYHRRDGLALAAKKLRAGGGTYKVAFIGGSVTEGAGASDAERYSYRALTGQYLASRYPEVAFTFVNAAVGGTDSVYGAYRFREHVLKTGPVDLLFVEFAVNDAGDRTASVRAMEGIARQAKRSNPRMAIGFIYSPNTAGLRLFREQGRVQPAIGHHEEVAAHYGIPSLSIARSIYEGIAAGELRWEDYSGDEVHPHDAGFGLYGGLVETFLRETLGYRADGDADQDETAGLPEPLEPSCYEHAGLLPPGTAERAPGWRHEQPWRFEHVCYWKLPGEALIGDTAGAAFRLRFQGTAAGIAVLAGMDLGDIEFAIDGGRYEPMRLFDSRCASFYRPKIVLLAEGLVPGGHTIDIRIAADMPALSTGRCVRILYFLVNA
ncbi:hypothetical protein I8J29_04655 [Paenibacillus sp. MWE-103]|uniref:SGNH hydrolase-type esterase domain-containing protein n=1 Tax=Paenibacillus artemisiicola TaxID=1172618 RepID=A0ABS3W585_9BACL|nr:SGNH/GDSL hydrolase family protein [Paenibacillus artemisiicola]MBO7743472.1 hypothetical protein [Paenibacillus artemisiicola]